MSVWSFLRTLEALTRPPRLGHDVDVPVPSEMVPEVCRAHRSEECDHCDEDNDDLWVHPRDLDGAEGLAEREAEEEVWDGGDIDIPIMRSGHRNIEDVANREPGLSDDELVAVRQLIEERFPLIECFPDSAVVPPGPADGPADGEARSPVAPSAGLPDDAGAAWVGWAVPAICTVLHEHQPLQPGGRYGDGYECLDSDGNNHATQDDWDYQAWLEHAAPLVAIHLQQALAAHECEKPDAAPGQKWRCWCGLAWRAVSAGPLDIRWEAYGRNQLAQVETGHDIGLSHAAELFPQHTNQKGTQ